MRVGSGLDAHRFGGAPPIVVGGVVVDEARGLEATSDGDVAVHAVIDALLGAAGVGDLGEHFPSSDPRWQGASSLALLDEAVAAVLEAGWQPNNVDLTIVSESIRIAPHRAAIREALGARLGLDVAAVSVKATSTDGLGFLGRDEGVAAFAVASVVAI